MKPLIGITCCSKDFGVWAQPNHAAADTYVQAVDGLVGAVPVLIPANGDAADIDSLLPRLDGVILTGSRSMVGPCHYSGPPHECGTPEDARRDAVTLRLVRAAVRAGVPVLAICRGFQEMNVALGGSLHQRLEDMPGRIDHSTALDELFAVRYAKAHAVELRAGSWLHRIAQTRSIEVNSLHHQGVDRLAPGLVADGVAPDGTIEAFSLPGTQAVGVQWHPECDCDHDPVSAGIFRDFGAAVHARFAGELAPDRVRQIG